MATADTLVLSYPADLSSWGRRQLWTPWFEAYLRKTAGTVAVGDRLDEFLDVGCCGDTLDVPLVVEALEGGDRVGHGTAIEWTERDACGLEGGWRVQSAAGPTG